ncbi:MAG: hypothetical protein AAFP77_05530 [Bacteroidota bacterium]
MKKTLLTTALLMAVLGVYATTFTSVTDGDWNDPQTWSPMGVPNVTNSAAWPGDNVIIDHAVNFTGRVTTAQQASVTINSGGSLTITGTLNIANSNNSTFTLASNGSLNCDNLIISTCCNSVTLDGTVVTNDFSFTGSTPVNIGGDMTVNGDFNGGTNSSINFTGGTFSVAGSSNVGGSAQLTVDGGAVLSLGDLSLSGDADIVGVGSGGVIGFNTISMANSSTNIRCVNNACNYNGGAGSPPPPNPLDLVSGGQSLPVDLLDYQVKVLEQKEVLIRWTTATELDNDYFLLEHSTDGRVFKKLATIAGQGSTESESQYQWLHKTPQATNNYYRLWQFDYDGSTTMLGLQQVRLCTSTFTIEGVSPNPGFSGGSVRMDLPTDTHSIQVYLVCSNGQQWPLLFESDGQVQLPANVPSGVYHIRVIADQEVSTIPISIISG